MLGDDFLPASFIIMSDVRLNLFSTANKDIAPVLSFSVTTFSPAAILHRHHSYSDVTLIIEIGWKFIKIKMSEKWM